MSKLDDLIEELREDGRESDAEELEKLRGSSLRKKVKDTERLEKELAEANARIEGLEKAPKLRKAFEEAGVDFGSLSKLERKAIEGYDGELDGDAIADFIEENEIEASAAEGGEGEEAPAAAQVAQAARKASEGRGGKAPKLTPDEVSQWDAGRWMAFKDSHPEEAEALMRGEEVVGLTA